MELEGESIAPERVGRNQEYQNSVQEEEHGLRKPVRDELRN